MEDIVKIVRIIGGLGNQFAQYAFAVWLRNKTGDRVLLDTNWFKNIKPSYTKREYQLDLFNIKIPAAIKLQIRLCKHPIWCVLLNPVLAFLHITRPSNEIEEQYYTNKELPLYGNKYYKGWFFNEKYFKDYRTEILQELSLKIPLDVKNQKMLRKIKATNSISLHVRRGDYLKLTDVFGLCSLDYYSRAVEQIAKKVKNPHFFLFSDDPTWIKENIKLNYPSTIVDINDGDHGYFDMELMKNCKHNIIANSTFSWWASWLNENPNKIVISPQKNDIIFSK